VIHRRDQTFHAFWQLFDLLQTKELPKGVERLVTAMNNSSSLLLKIISDILDFSKIESEQLKIEPREFSPREVMNHIT
ncbi:hypothetical protein OFB72_33280, partial [Escherichia coli]|nr:hypothetical protein [Escherichia coli]